MRQLRQDQTRGRRSSNCNEQFIIHQAVFPLSLYCSSFNSFTSALVPFLRADLILFLQKDIFFRRSSRSSCSRRLCSANCAALAAAAARACTMWSGTKSPPHWATVSLGWCQNPRGASRGVSACFQSLAAFRIFSGNESCPASLSSVNSFSFLFASNIRRPIW